MIRYALKCANGHRFESWFQSGAAFDTLQASGMVACAVCGEARVEKDLMAPHVSAESAAPPATCARDAAPAPAEERPLSAPANPAEQALKRVRAFIETHSENVGQDFARQAREMHAGAAEARPIHGQAKPEEARQLAEEGVPIAPLPFDPDIKSN